MPLSNNERKIDSYLFDQQFERFKRFIEKQEPQMPFQSLQHHKIREMESYKEKIYEIGRDRLDFLEWQRSEIGSGKIAEKVISAIEIERKEMVPTWNNLVEWTGRYRPISQSHHREWLQADNPDEVRETEEAVYQLYREENPQAAFGRLQASGASQYDILGYLFFLKDKTQFLPIKSGLFEDGFSLFGIDLKTKRHASWSNYSDYLSVMTELKDRLQERLEGVVTLLDTHSFFWILIDEVDRKTKTPLIPRTPKLKLIPRPQVDHGTSSTPPVFRGRKQIDH